MFRSKTQETKWIPSRIQQVCDEIVDKKKKVPVGLHFGIIVVQYNAAFNPVMLWIRIKASQCCGKLFKWSQGAQKDLQQMPHMTIPLHMLLWEQWGM